MVLNDPLANALSAMLNNERIGKLECNIYPSSKLIQRVFDILKEKGYISVYEVTKDDRGARISVKLAGHINKCGVIKPRYSVKVDGLEKYEKRYLPAKDFGILILSTPKGLMTHQDAKEKNLGGKLIAYCY